MRHSIAVGLATIFCAGCASPEAAVELPSFYCTPVRFGDVPIGKCVAGEVECPWPLGAVATALEVVPPDPSVTSDLSARAVRYCPRDRVDLGATLEIRGRTPEGIGLTSAVRLSGSATWGEIEAPSTFDLGDIEVGQTTQRQLTIRNVGTGPLRVASVVVTQPFLAEFAPTTLGGDRTNVSLQVTPAALGALTGTLEIESDDRDHPTWAVALTAEVRSPPPPPPPPAQCVFEIWPTTLDFGAVEPDRFVTGTIELRNTGSGIDCFVSSVRLIGGGASRWRVRPPWTTGLASLAPGQAAFVTVEREVLSLDLGTAMGEATVVIEGGRAPYPAVEVPILLRLDPDIPLIMPRNLDFVSIPSGCARRPRTVRIHNTTPRALSGALTWSSSSPGFAVSPTRLAVEAGASDVVDVDFQPVTSGRWAAALSLGGPNLAVDLRGHATSAAQAERFELFGLPSVDLLLVIDGLLARGPQVEQLADAIGVLVEQLRQRGIYYQVGVTTAQDLGAGGRLFPSNGAAVVVGELSTPSPGEVLAGLIRSIAPNGAPVEPLAVARRALTMPLAAGHNTGFQRRTADLAVLVVASDDDASAGSVALYADTLLSRPWVDARATLSAIAAGSLCSSGLDVTRAAPRLAQAVERTGGLLASSCDQDWDVLLRAFADIVLGPRRRFVLRGEADPASVVVRLDGAVVTERDAGGAAVWRYEPETRTLVLDRSLAGRRLEVSYQPSCL
jgi:hypothetical protein